MTWNRYGTASNTALRLGPPENTFTGATLGDAETARDTYFTTNPSSLAAYNSNPNYLARLVYEGGVSFTGRYAGSWVDYSPVVEGQPGEVASLVNVPVGEIPFKKLDGTFGGSNMRVLDDGTILAPPGFGVESGSVSFGDVLVLSEAAGFLAIDNLLNGRTYTLLDYETPRNAPSSVPRQFKLTGAESQFPAQPIFTTQLTANPLTADYTVQNTGRNNALTFKTFAPMSNVLIKITKMSNGVVAKYIPNKTAWEEDAGGLTWIAGDNTFDFEDTPLIFNTGDVIRFEIRSTSNALLGSPATPYISSLQQLAVFNDVVMADGYTSTDVRDKLSALTGANRLSITAIKDSVTTVAGRTGDVIISASDISGLASVATTGAYSSLTGLPTIPTTTSQLTNNSGFITAAQVVVQSVQGRTGAVVLTATDVGLGNVDNTSDTNKPVSTAQQTAIDLKMTQHNAAGDPHPQYTTTLEAANAAPVQSVNGSTGTVTLNTSSIPESGNLYYTDARVTTYLANTGYTVRSVGGVGTGASVYQTTSGGLATFRAINGAGLITVTQNANDITIAAPTVTGGTYTPTLTGVANVSASTAYVCHYMRVDGTVTVSGKVDIDPNVSATSTKLGMSLPIASDIGTVADVGGVGSCVDISQVAGILGDVTNNRAQFEFINTTTANRSFYFTFSYKII